MTSGSLSVFNMEFLRVFFGGGLNFINGSVLHNRTQESVSTEHSLVNQFAFPSAPYRGRKMNGSVPHKHISNFLIGFPGEPAAPRQKKTLFYNIRDGHIFPRKA